MVNLPFRPQPLQGRERGPFNKTPQWDAGRDLWSTASWSSPNLTVKLSEPCVQLFLPFWVFRSGSPEALAGWHRKAYRRNCVPVTLPALLHCLPLLRRPASGQRPMEETPFHWKIHPSPAQRCYGMAEQLPTSCRVSPWPGCLLPQKQWASIISECRWLVYL